MVQTSKKILALKGNRVNGHFSCSARRRAASFLPKRRPLPRGCFVESDVTASDLSRREGTPWTDVAIFNPALKTELRTASSAGSSMTIASPGAGQLWYAGNKLRGTAAQSGRLANRVAGWQCLLVGEALSAKQRDLFPAIWRRPKRNWRASREDRRLAGSAVPPDHELPTTQMKKAYIAVSLSFCWRPHGDSNPGYRRERAMS